MIQENNFAEEYITYKNLKEKCRTIEDPKEREPYREALSAFCDEINENGLDYAQTFKEYKDACERGNEYMDVDDVAYLKDVADVLRRYRNFGLTEFAFSSTWTDAIEMAWQFIEQGCKLTGMEEINGRNGKKPAFIFEIPYDEFRFEEEEISE